jgi:hypothetical protein
VPPTPTVPAAWIAATLAGIPHYLEALVVLIGPVVHGLP